MKKINILLPTLVALNSLPILTTTTSCGGALSAIETTVNVSGHTATFSFKVSGNTSGLKIKNYDENVLRFSRTRWDQKNEIYYLFITVLIEPDNKSYPLTFEYYDNARGKTRSIGLTVKNENLNTFETDTWENVIYYANQGSTVLRQHYNVELLIGHQRGIVINGIAHKVRVVDENADTYGDDNKVAALTFEFVDLISETVTSEYTNIWSDAHYEFTAGSSGLYVALKDNSSRFVKMLPSYLTVDNGIKMTNRKVIEHQTVKWLDHKVTKYQSKLFLPCLADLFSETGIQKMSGDASYGENIDWYKEEISDARSSFISGQYAYYFYLIGDDKPASNLGLHCEKLIKSNPFSTSESRYWLGTPLCVNTSLEGCAWNQDYNKMSATHADRAIGIAPFFCI